MTINPLDYAEPYQEALGTYEGFRRLGFSADDIYFLANGPFAEFDGKTQLCIVLRTQGKQYVVNCGRSAEKPDDIETTWRLLATACSTGNIDVDAYKLCWQQSLVHAAPAMLVNDLVLKGFRLPKAAN